MSENLANRRKEFAAVVTIEAWHGKFGPNSAKVDLHVDVVFGTSRVGGEPESPVRFCLSVKQADVVIIVPETEPVAIDKKSVSRDTPKRVGRLKSIVKKSQKGKLKGAAKLLISALSPSGSFSASRESEVTEASQSQFEMAGDLNFIFSTQKKTEDGDYCWSLTPGENLDVLSGRPWDAVKQPRLKLIDKRPNRGRGIPPSVRVEVRCLREDLSITKIQLKDRATWTNIKARVGMNNRMAAAEAYIRNCLSSQGLTVDNMSDLYARLTLASVIAEA